MSANIQRGATGSGVGKWINTIGGYRSERGGGSGGLLSGRRANDIALVVASGAN
jgi:hypothetical protein